MSFLLPHNMASPTVSTQTTLSFFPPLDTKLITIVVKFPQAVHSIYNFIGSFLGDGLFACVFIGLNIKFNFVFLSKLWNSDKHNGSQ
jgi:hypothetical protein